MGEGMSVPDNRRYYVEFGRRLRAARLAKGLTCEALAVAIGQSRAQIHNIEAASSRILLHDAHSLAAMVGKPLARLIPRIRRPKLVAIRKRIVMYRVSYKIGRRR
jgi:transcriptional regulator with XRE-family HTH domain